MAHHCSTSNGDPRTPAGFRVNSSIAWQVVDGEVVLLDLSDGTVVGLSPTASHIWPLIESSDEDSIVASLVAAFEVNPEIARVDVRQFVSTCLESSYLVPTGDGSSV